MGEISAHACMITNVWHLIFATFYWNALMLKAHRGNHSWGNIFNHWVGIDHSKQLHNLIHSSIPTLWWMVDQRNEKAMRTPIYSLFRVLYSWICFTMNAFKMNIERLHLIDKVFQYRQTCRFWKMWWKCLTQRNWFSLFPQSIYWEWAMWLRPLMVETTTFSQCVAKAGQRIWLPSLKSTG